MTDLVPLSNYDLFPVPRREATSRKKVRAVLEQADARNAELIERYKLAKEADTRMNNLGDFTNQTVVDAAKKIFDREGSITDPRLRQVAARNGEQVLNVVNGTTLGILHITGQKFGDLVNAEYQDPPEEPRGFWRRFVRGPE